MGAVPDGQPKDDLQLLFEEMLRRKPRQGAPGRWIDLLEPPIAPPPPPDIPPQLGNAALYAPDEALDGVRVHWAAFSLRNPRTAAWFAQHDAQVDRGNFPIPLFFHYLKEEQRLDTHNYLKQCTMLAPNLVGSCGPVTSLALHAAYADFLFAHGDEAAKDLAYRMVSRLVRDLEYLRAELPPESCGVTREEFDDLARCLGEEILWPWHGTGRWKDVGAAFDPRIPTSATQWPLDALRGCARRDAIDAAKRAAKGKPTVPPESPASPWRAHLRDPLYLTALKCDMRLMDLSMENWGEGSWRTDPNWRRGTVRWMDLYNAYAGCGDFLAAGFCEHCGQFGQLHMLVPGSFQNLRAIWRGDFGDAEGDRFFLRYLDACHARYGPIYAKSRFHAEYYKKFVRIRCRAHADQALAEKDAKRAIAWLMEYPPETPDEKKQLDREIRRLSSHPSKK